MIAIDTHVHLVSPEQIEQPRIAAHLERMGLGLPRDPLSVLLDIMNGSDISKAWILAPAPGIRCSNEAIREAVAAHPKQLLGFARVDPLNQSAEQTEKTIRQAVEEWGFSGVGEFGHCDYTDTACDVVFRTCAELGVPVVLHVGTPIPGVLLKHGHPFLLDEIADRYPDLTLVATHVGVPWVLETMAVATRHPNVYLDIAGLPLFNEALVSYLLAVLLGQGLTDRVMFGSGYPLDDPATYLADLRDLRFSRTTRRATGAPVVDRTILARLLVANAHHVTHGKSPETQEPR